MRKPALLDRMLDAEAAKLAEALDVLESFVRNADNSGLGIDLLSTRNDAVDVLRRNGRAVNP